MAVDSIELKSELAVRPGIATLLIWNTLIFALSRRWIELSWILSLQVPAEALSPISSVGVTLIRLFTYTFIHNSAGHLFTNMLWFLIFGWSLYPRLGTLRFLLLYFAGGFSGGLLFIATAKFGGMIPAAGSLTLCGASASVMALTLCALVSEGRVQVFSTRSPRLNHFLQIRCFALLAAAITFIISPLIHPDLLSASAHAGGAVFGLLYGFYLHKYI